MSEYYCTVLMMDNPITARQIAHLFNKELEDAIRKPLYGCVEKQFRSERKDVIMK